MCWEARKSGSTRIWVNGRGTLHTTAWISGWLHGKTWHLSTLCLRIIPACLIVMPVQHLHALEPSNAIYPTRTQHKALPKGSHWPSASRILSKLSSLCYTLPSRNYYIMRKETRLTLQLEGCFSSCGLSTFHSVCFTLCGSILSLFAYWRPAVHFLVTISKKNAKSLLMYKFSNVKIEN